MNHHPHLHFPNKDNWSRLWDVLAPWVVGILALLLIVTILDDHLLQEQNLTYQHNSHVATVKSRAKQDKLINLLIIKTDEVKSAIEDHSSTLTDIKNLQTTFNTVIPILESLPGADAYLDSLATDLIKDVNDLCTSTKACTPINIPTP